jgi:hypothetical protein
MKQPKHKVLKSSFHFVQHGSWGWKVALIYDFLMLGLITFNLFCLSANAFLMSDYADWLFNFTQLPHVLSFYESELHPWVKITEGWFTSFLVFELAVRWMIAIGFKHHQRWWFFPFIHWYEIISILPMFRFLRLGRAFAIAYNLHSHGYTVIPQRWYARGNFYYRLLMEELTSRIVLTLINAVKTELQTSTTHKKYIEDIVNHHRELLATALADVLQDSLGKELQAQRHDIAKNVGLVVNKAIEDTPELSQMLRLIPLVGGRIEQQIQSIGQRLGENISQGLLEPFTHSKQARDNATYKMIAEKVSQVAIENNPEIDRLVESAVFESLDALREQVKIKQWQQVLAQKQADKE